jgi:hypothetical protein
MGDDAERIRRKMHHLRQEMGADVKGIVHGARQLSDWRFYLRQHPWACVGSAFALGFLAAPVRRKSLDGDVEKLLEQLRRNKAAAALGLAPSAGGSLGSGLLKRALAVGGPILARQAASYFAKRVGDAQYTAGAAGTYEARD